MIRQTKIVLTPNLTTFVQDIVDLTADGWEIEQEPRMFGFSYECHLAREISEEQAEADANKPSRAEILARARAAKAEKQRLREEGA